MKIEKREHTCEECVHFKRYYIKLREDSFVPRGIGECLYDPDSIGMNPRARACSNFSEFEVMPHEWRTDHNMY